MLAAFEEIEMTRNEIKEASANGYSNWEILGMLTTDGIEYPDAVGIVASTLRLPKDEREQMERDYDECC